MKKRKRENDTCKALIDEKYIKRFLQLQLYSNVSNVLSNNNDYLNS